ncbi:hypothetical protein ACOMHN_051859 [Nucella lapillus]
MLAGWIGQRSEGSVDKMADMEMRVDEIGAIRPATVPVRQTHVSSKTGGQGIRGQPQLWSVGQSVQHSSPAPDLSAILCHSAL